MKAGLFASWVPIFRRNSLAKKLMPLAVTFSLAAWMALSFCYSVYVDNFAHYSILYGSIGTAIVLLIWLYMSSVVLIMGAEFNGTLISLRKDRTA